MFLTNDIFLEVVRAIQIIFTFVYMIYTGRKRKLNKVKGWNYLLVGFALLLFATLIDITDNFESLNKYVVIGDTETQAILEKVVGYLGGFLFLAIGFLKWLPKVAELSEMHAKLARLNIELEEKVQERTENIDKAREELEAKNRELAEFNQLVVGREKKMIELKEKIRELEEKKSKG